MILKIINKFSNKKMSDTIKASSPTIEVGNFWISGFKKKSKIRLRTVSVKLDPFKLILALLVISLTLPKFLA